MLGWWPIFTGMPSVLRAQSIALSATTTCVSDKWAALSPFFFTLSLFPFCFYKWMPLTLMFSYRFSDWKLISRLVNTMEPDSKHHAVCSALPAVLLGPSLDLLFVLIEFICLPLASASLFFVRFREAIVLGESPPYCSTKQTAGFFNLLGSVLLTGWNLSLPPSRMLRVSVFCVGADGGLFAQLVYAGSSCAVGQTIAGFTFRCNATLPPTSPRSPEEHLFFKSQNQHPAPDSQLPGSLWYHMLSLWPDPVLCGSLDGTLDGQHTVIKEV